LPDAGKVKRHFPIYNFINYQQGDLCMNHGTDFSRRDFIKISSLFLAGSAAFATLPSGIVTGLSSNPIEGKGEKIVYSFCEHCFWRCGISHTCL